MGQSETQCRITHWVYTFMALNGSHKNKNIVYLKYLNVCMCLRNISLCEYFTVLRAVKIIFDPYRIINI